MLGFDVGLVRAPVTGRQPLKPDQLLLVVEVSETTQRRDLDMKRCKYAEAGIETYWVIDESRGIIHVHGEPRDGVYTDVHTIRFGEPLAVPGTDATITLS
ncbi:Uma2 family endonuclease [Sphingomonas sp.]|uniref:Uma2 family endonuclease n=1 Tax=Sphingomonas sp. TaxID=28214 RepID=UPI003CC64FA7